MTKEERLAALKALKTHLDKGVFEECADGRCILPVYIPEEILQEASACTDGYVYITGFWENHKAVGLLKDPTVAFKKGRDWVDAEIAKMEQPPIDPKEIIEAAAADEAGMDAAESLLDRERMRFEIGRKVHDFQSAVRHLYKALDAGYAKDDEIAALKKENEALLQQHLSRDKDVTKMRLDRDMYIEQLENDVLRLSERLNQYKAAEPKVDQPAPVRLPAHGDVIEARYNKNSDWEKVEVYADSPENPRFIMGSLSIKACQETYDKGVWRWPEPTPARLPAAGDTIEIPSVHGPVGTWDKVVTYMKCGEVKYDAGPFTPTADEHGLKRGAWRWPEPRTRTAADAKIGENVWHVWNGSTRISPVYFVNWGAITVRVVTDTDYNREIPYNFDEFGITWGYAEEETK